MATGKVFFHPSGQPKMNTQLGITMRCVGTEQVVNNLNAKIKLINGALLSGLVKVAMFTKEDMDETPPLIPIKTDLLRTNFKIYPKQVSPKTVGVEMGWPDNKFVGTGENGENISKDAYAAYVHEMTQPPYTHPIDWSRPGSGPKFFEAAIKRNTVNGNYLRIIANDIKLHAGI